MAAPSLCWSKIAVVLLCVGLFVACRQGSALPERQVASDAPSDAPTRVTLSETAPLAPAAPSAAASPEAPPRLDPAELILPPDHAVQRLAFSRYRLAWLDGEELTVLRVDGFELATRFRAPGARNVVALVGGGFLIAGREHVLRLSGIERRPETFPRAPRLGPTLILPSNQESEQFWLYYQGIPKLPKFDLAEPGLTSLLPVVGWIELVDFDRLALLSFGDGSLLYTVPDGLRRIDAEGRREHLPAPELAGRVWRLARARRLDQVWAATPHHAYLLTARGRAEALERFELPPHPVAFASEGRELAVLSVESVDAGLFRLRIDVVSHGAGTRRVMRFTVRPPVGDGGAGAAIEPDLALSPLGDWVAVSAFGLHVYDWRREARVFPPPPGAQNLAPSPP